MNLKSVLASLRAVVALAVAAVLLAGCARLPMAGEVRQGQFINDGMSSEQLYYSPSGPIQGATMEDIVSGFLNAGTGPQNDYAVAREYLSEDYRADWRPSDEVLVETGRPVITFDTEKRAQVTIRVQSQLDERGIYSVAKAGTERTLTYTFVREHGEWRISSAPNLTVLIRPIFEAIFHSYSLYFFDQQRKFLVPDLRWFPARASTSTRLVSELFRGPSEWLADAVTTSIPSDLKLSLASVSVSNGIASVDLNSKFLSLNATQKLQFKAQLSATLRQLATVTSVQVLVERSPQSIGDLDAKATPSSPASPVVLTATDFKHSTGAQSANFNNIADLAAEYRALDFAVSADESRAALAGPEGIHLVLLSSIGSRPMLVDARSEVLRPQFDRQGYLWSLGKNSVSQIRAIAMDGTAYAVPAGWLAVANREEFAISPEGSRIVARLNTPTGSQVWVSAINRDKTGRPVGFGTPIQLISSVKTPSSIAWAGEVQVAVLDQNDGVRTVPHLITIGADSSSLVGIEGGMRLLSSAVGELYVVNRLGDLYRYKTSNWERVTDGVIAAHFSGQ